MEKFVNQLTIGLDLDGVIIDHTANLIRLSREFGFSIQPNQTPGHRLRKIVGEDNYLKIRQILYGPTTKSSVPMTGALDCLRKLKMDNSVFIISARFKKNQPVAWDWINHYLSNIFDKQKIIFIEQEKYKNSICQKLKIDIYLDDKIEVLENLLSVPKRCLFDKYNIRNDFDLVNIRPVSSWQDFFDYVKKQSD